MLAELLAGTRPGGHTAESEAAAGAPLGGQAISGGAEEAGSDWPAQTAAETKKAMQLFETMEGILRIYNSFAVDGMHFESSPSNRLLL